MTIPAQVGSAAGADGTLYIMIPLIELKVLLTFLDEQEVTSPEATLIRAYVDVLEASHAANG
jgi:hypothetical protein